MISVLRSWFPVYVERARRARAAGWRTELHYHHAMGRRPSPWRRKMMLRAARIVAAGERADALDVAVERAMEVHVDGDDDLARVEDRIDALIKARARARRVHGRMAARAEVA